DRALAPLYRRLRDARVGIPEAARAGARRARVPARVRRAGPAGRALLVHRRAPALGAALVAGRRRRSIRAGGRLRGALPPSARAGAVRAIAEVRRRLAGPVPRAAPEPGAREMPAFQPNMTRERFQDMVARIVQYIHAGDAFQVVPSQRWSARVPVEAFSIYRGLRAVNPSPYMYFLDFGDFQVAGASPEPLLTVSGRRVSTKPIAGTRPRGATPDDDRRIAQE